MKKLKSIRNLAVLAGVASMLISPASAGRVLDFTEGGPNRGARAAVISWLADEAKKRTNGELEIKIHWGGALLKSKAAPKGIGSGAADMGTVIGAYNPKLHPGLLLADLPTKYSDPWVGLRALHELATTQQGLIAEFDQLNLRYLTSFTTTQIQVICKDRVIKSLADIEGIKVRGIGVYGKVFKDLGATPVRISAYKAYQGLDTGLIDCSQVYAYFVPSVKLQEVAKEMTLLDWGAVTGLAFAVNKDTWNSLTPDQQKTLDALGSEFIDRYAEKIIAGNQKALKDLAKGIDGHKVNIHSFPDAEKRKLVEAAQTYVDDWAQKASAAGYDAEAFRNQYLDLLKKYDDERRSKGYPWTR